MLSTRAALSKIEKKAETWKSGWVEVTKLIPQRINCYLDNLLSAYSDKNEVTDSKCETPVEEQLHAADGCMLDDMFLNLLLRNKSVCQLTGKLK